MKSLVLPEAQDIIYKVYVHCAAEAKVFLTEDGYFQNVAKRAALATGMPIKYIRTLVECRQKIRQQILKEEAKNNKRKSKSNELVAVVASNSNNNEIGTIYIKNPTSSSDLEPSEKEKSKEIIESNIEPSITARKMGTRPVITYPRSLKKSIVEAKNAANTNREKIEGATPESNVKTINLIESTDSELTFIKIEHSEHDAVVATIVKTPGKTELPTKPIPKQQKAATNPKVVLLNSILDNVEYSPTIPGHIIKQRDSDNDTIELVKSCPKSRRRRPQKCVRQAARLAKEIMSGTASTPEAPLQPPAKCMKLGSALLKVEKVENDI